LDGTETISTVIGTLLSPIISEKLTYYGSYGLYGGMIVLAALYLKFFVREPIKKKKDESKNSKEKRSAYNVLYSTLVTPLIDIKTLVVKKRKNILTIIIILQLIIYAVYVFAYYSNGLLYLYMLVKFEGFTAADYSYFTVAISLGNTFFLVIFMPIVSGKFGMNDALLMTIISIAETLSLVVSPFITSLPLFYASQMLSTIGYCKYSVGRSLLSKSCEPDEMGKLFSIQTVLISLASMACNPIVRKVYNETLKSFPGAFMLLSASLLLLSGFGNLFIYINRKELKQSNQEELEEDIKDKIDLAAIDAKNITTYM
jgi:PCFT/HCP family folate transporter-like MFS transporter 1/3